jgi:hypothetical protein
MLKIVPYGLQKRAKHPSKSLGVFFCFMQKRAESVRSCEALRETKNQFEVLSFVISG